MNVTDPHRGQDIAVRGEPLQTAVSAMILVHQRGGSTESILSLIPHFDAPKMAFLAPQAAQNTWYPHSFLAPIPQNEPGISSGIGILRDLVTTINEAGIPSEKIALLGFSQGACLAAEFVARDAQRFGGLAVLSGGLIGPPNTPRTYEGHLHGTPIFLGCSDVDFHIPKERVDESAALFTRMGATVTKRIYPGMAHTIIADEITAVQEMINSVTK